MFVVANKVVYRIESIVLKRSYIIKRIKVQVLSQM